MVQAIPSNIVRDCCHVCNTVNGTLVAKQSKMYMFVVIFDEIPQEKNCFYFLGFGSTAVACMLVCCGVCESASCVVISKFVKL